MTYLYVKPPAGNRAAVVVLGGGSSVASADICSRHGLDTPPLEDDTQAELKKFINIAGASVRNPLDTGHVFSDISRLRREIDLVSADPNIDMLIVRPHLDMVRGAGPNQVERTIEYLSDICRHGANGKPAVLVLYSFSNQPWETELRARLQTELPSKGVPVYGSLDAACRSLAKLYRYHCIQAEAAPQHL